MTTVCGGCSTPKGFASELRKSSRVKNLLTTPATDGSLRPSQNRLMSKVCSITGSKPSRGSVIHRRGMAKKKGGVGRHVTKNVPRTFQSKSARATDLGRGVEEIRARESDGARLEDDQQKRRLRDVEKSRSDRGLILCPGDISAGLSVSIGAAVSLSLAGRGFRAATGAGPSSCSSVGFSAFSSPTFAGRLGWKALGRLPAPPFSDSLGEAGFPRSR